MTTRPTRLGRWRGLISLVQDVTANGATAIERVHLETARRVFSVATHAIAEFSASPATATAATELLHALHDRAATASYEGVRLVAHLVGGGANAALATLDSPVDGAAEHLDGRDTEPTRV